MLFECLFKTRAKTARRRVRSRAFESRTIGFRAVGHGVFASSLVDSPYDEAVCDPPDDDLKRRDLVWSFFFFFLRTRFRTSSDFISAALHSEFDRREKRGKNRISMSAVVV